MERFFNIFGKVMLILMVLGGLTYGGYYFGKQTKTTEVQVKSNEEKVAKQVAPTQLLATPSALVTITAGLSKSAGLSFDQYSIMIPSDWTSKKESQTAMDEKLTLTKDGSVITIFQAATGGALCLYPGDADFEGPNSKFTKFIELVTNDDRILRRSGEDTNFTVCQKSGDGSFQQPTNYGHIAIKTIENPTLELLSEIDNIISSLKKI